MHALPALHAMHEIHRVHRNATGDLGGEGQIHHLVGQVLDQVQHLLAQGEGGVVHLELIDRQELGLLVGDPGGRQEQLKVFAVEVWLEHEDPGLPVPDGPQLPAAEGGWVQMVASNQVLLES